ncbi:ribonuclease R, partial [Deinococcus radiodurans]
TGRSRSAAPAPESETTPAPKRGRQPKAAPEESAEPVLANAGTAESADTEPEVSEAPAAPKPRRSRKPKATANVDEGPAEVAASAEQPKAPAPKRRGRKPKAQAATAPVEEVEETPAAAAEPEAVSEPAPAPAKRGRKPKAPAAPEQPSAELTAETQEAAEAPKPRRGRKPRAQAPAEPTTEDSAEAALSPVLDATAPQEVSEPQEQEQAPTEAPAPKRRGRRKAVAAEPAPLSDVLDGVEAVDVETLENAEAPAPTLTVAHEAEAAVPTVDSALAVEDEATPAAPEPDSTSDSEPRQSRKNRKERRAERQDAAPQEQAPAEDTDEDFANIPDEERLLVAQLRKLGRPVHVRDLERTFTRQALERLGGWRNITDLLEDLVESGKVIRTRKKTYGLPEAMSLVRGRFQASAAGFGFVVPDSNMGKGGGEDYYIPQDRTLEAWNGDTVLVRMDGRGDSRSDRDGGRDNGRGGRRGQKGDGNPRATVVRIVQRAYKQLVGTLEFSHGHPILKPDDFRARHRILLLPEGLEELEAGARVVTELFWPEHTGEDEVFGQVVRVLGAEDDPETETEAVIVKFGLRGEFPDDVQEQANAIPGEIPEEALVGRLDLREFNIFTVDGRDAKDFDDAIHIQPTPEGNFVVGVHIADVSHYVQEGTPLDGEAYARATSVYLPGRVLPMLPEHLSNGVCSLVPYQDRLTMTALVELSAEGDILDVKLSPSVINSKARLTYDEVQAYSEATATLPDHARHLEGDLHLLLKITTKLRQKRLREGSLDFKLREVKVDVDKDGRMELIPIREETARGMIEDLMLLANKVVAHYLIEREIPTLFRIHEEPTLQKFQDVTGAIGRLGFSFPGGEPTPQAYQAVLKQVRGTGRESVVNTLLLRSMQQAKYAGENLGHFGLAFDEYLHFTSPIRRYPDLVVHRTLKKVLSGDFKAGNREVAQFQGRLPSMGEHTSDRERTAAEAERDLTKYYQCKWAQEHRGESFMGNVSGVVSSGLYVALDNGVEGKLHISHLDDDYYIFIEDAQILKGRSNGKSFRLGDAVQVTISDVKPLARQIDLTLADPEDPDYTPGSYDLPAAAQETPMTDVKVRARRREDREQERQEKLKSIPVTQPKFTLDDPQPAIQSSPQLGERGPRQSRGGRGGQGQYTREGQPSRGQGGPNGGRTFGGMPLERGERGGRSSGPRRVITLERPRNEHLRPVNITVQRMYFGDWTTDNMPPEDGYNGPRAGRERGYDRGERRGEGRGYTRGGNDRGAARLNGNGGPGAGRGSQGQPRSAAPRAAAPQAPVAAAEPVQNSAPSDAQSEEARRRRRRRGRRGGAPGSAE